MKKLFTSFIAVLFCLVMVAPVMAQGPNNFYPVELYCCPSVGILSIEGSAGITMHKFNGYSNSRDYSLVGANFNDTFARTYFRGVSVGSNSYSNATRMTLGGSNYRLTGSGVFTANSYGSIGMNLNNGGSGYVSGTYGTSSTVHIYAQ